MKRYGQLWEKICDTENIELAAVNSVKGKKQTRARRIFLENRAIAQRSSGIISE